MAVWALAKLAPERFEVLRNRGRRRAGSGGGKPMDGSLVSRLFAFGLGYSAQTLASRLAAKGWEIAGTARDPATIERLTQRGNNMARFAELSDRDGVVHLLPGTTHLLHSIPPVAASIRCSQSSANNWLRSLRFDGSAICRPSASMAAAMAHGWLHREAGARNARTKARVVAEKEWLAVGERADVRSKS